MNFIGCVGMRSGFLLYLLVSYDYVLDFLDSTITYKLVVFCSFLAYYYFERQWRIFWIIIDSYNRSKKTLHSVTDELLVPV